MSKKVIQFAIMTVGVVLLIFFADEYKQYQQEKPPLPIIEVNNRVIPVHIGAYEWHGTDVEFTSPEHLLDPEPALSVNEFDQIQVNFQSEHSPMKLTVSEWDIPKQKRKKLLEEEGFSAPFNTWDEGFVYLVVDAVWKKGAATYFIKLSVTQYGT
ncbi:hypothetical protein LS684_01905 [Cytobacillus spongiae]|jgi:hypothetical protein|uniref:hypothetical protein n=1 Tax=Cytobacillus spongiae TaxID=2901381 RepID=UPI001F30DF55|nr:hypothetical protein [Cytobacillus spongiae]UII56267.1 hypothetical protein LS684_01905 [Cytobacillus spongiae]